MIEEGVAVFEAVGRVIGIMQDHFGDELLRFYDTGIPLPAPTEVDYFLELNEPDPDQAVRNSSVAVFVFQERDSLVEDLEAYTPTSYVGTQSTFVGIKIVYRLRPAEPYPMLGKVPTVSDIMSARGYLYTAAALATVRKYACDNEIIADIEKISDHAVVEFDEDSQPILGIVSLVFRFTQRVEIPTCQH